MKKRQLAAIMFTDIVGFSAMMQVDEQLAVRTRNRHREVFRRLHEKHGGKILQYYGDGTLSIFDSAAAAVECAVEMQVEFREDPKVPLRIGIHTGDITYEEEGAYGDGLNIAARIEPLCEPGGVFVSGKVYDDIKNHPWLRARSLGDFNLKNILNEVELFAVTSKGLPAPQLEQSRQIPVRQPAVSTTSFIPGNKEKKTAALLALFLGIFGAHRFYLGQRRRGILYLVFASIGILAGGDGPFLPIMAIIAVIDAILLFTMSQEEFDFKYNQVPIPAKAPAYEREKAYHREEEPAGGNPYKKWGVRKFRAGDYQGALIDFRKALEKNPDDMAVHFNLACCYSIFHEGESALDHLAKAVELGFWDYEKIHHHAALEYLRSLESFDNFVKNDYRLVKTLPQPDEETLLELPSEPDLLDQIANLGELMERGVISREEFDEQKRKLLNGE